MWCFGVRYCGIVVLWCCGVVVFWRLLAVVRIFDAHTGRAVSTINHNLDVLEIALSQFSGDMNERRLAFIDQNRDLYITPVMKEQPVRALCATCVKCLCGMCYVC